MPLQIQGADRTAGDLVLGARGRAAGVQPAEVVSRGELAQQEIVAWDDKSKDVFETPVAGAVSRLGPT